MAEPNFDPRVRLFVNDTWTDVTGRLRQDPQISIITGRKDRGKTPEPGTCSLTLENVDGAFSLRNPLSPFVGSLNRYTPIVVLLDEMRDAYGRVSASGWSTTDTGETWATKSVGAPINATDYSVDGSSGNHLIPAAAAYRMSYLGSASGAASTYNGEIATSFTLPFTNVTGAAVEPGNVVLRLQTDTTYYLVRVTIETDETVRVRLMLDGVTSLAGPVTVPGITHLAGQRLWVLGGAYDDTIYAAVWVGELDDRPDDWLIEVDDTTYGYGYFGVRTGAAAGNTNVPFTCSYGETILYPSQFNGEVPEWPQEFTDDGVDMTVDIEAGGILRRLSDDEEGMGSALRRYYAQTADPAPAYFWALDGGTEAIGGAATRGTNPLNFYGGADVPPFFASQDPKTVFGRADMAAWLPNGAQIALQGELTNQDFSGGSALKAFLQVPLSGYFAFDFTRRGGDDMTDFVLVGQNLGGSTNYQVKFEETTNTIEVVVSTSNVDTSLVNLDTTLLPTNAFDGAPHHFRIDVDDTGANRHWRLFLDSSLVASGNASNPQLTQVDVVIVQGGIPSDKTPRVGYQAVALFSDVTVDDSIEAYNAMRGYVGDYADNRFIRLMDEEEIRHFMTGFGTGVALGPQYDATLIEQFDEIMGTEGGLYRELLSARGLQYDVRIGLENLTVAATIDVGACELSPSFKPVDDDKDLVNQVTVNKVAGGVITYERVDGRLGTTSTKLGGAGRKRRKITVNPESDDQLLGIAQLAVGRGTVDKARFPSVSMNLMAPEVAGNLTLRRAVLNVRVGSRIKLTNMSRWHVYEDADLLVVGMHRLITPYSFEVEWCCTPYDPYRVFVLDTDRLDGEMTLVADLAAGAVTTFQGNPAGTSLWTTDAADFPHDAYIGGVAGTPGERVTLSGVTGSAAPQTFTLSARGVNGFTHAWPAGSSIRPVVDAVLG